MILILSLLFFPISIPVLLYMIYVRQREQNNILLYGTPYAPPPPPASALRIIAAIVVVVGLTAIIWKIGGTGPDNSGLMSTKYEPVFHPPKGGDELVSTEPSYLTPWAQNK